MRLALSFLICATIFCFSCGDTCEETYSYVSSVPVYSLAEEVKNAVEVQSPRDIENPERLYFKDDFIFLVESGEGIHVIDNQDPANPETIRFINIPGNHDVAIQDNFLYADNYTDLLVFDIADLDDISLVNRVESVFDFYGDFFMESSTDAGMIVTDWTDELIEETYEYDCGGGWFGATDDVAVLEASFDGAFSSGVNSSGSGTGGSMARFTINNGYLYAVDHYSVRPFDLGDASLPDAKNPVHIGWDIETIFPYGDNLFIGSMSGMYIYSVSQPSTPEYLSVFQHANACDPVIVDGDLAYVTLRDGTECQTFTNQLEVVNVSDLTNPQLVKTYAMDNPHGLGIKDKCLYICEGDYGLKYFDATNIEDSLVLKEHFEDIHALDVIALEDRLLMIGEDGFHQYDGVCEEEIYYLSTLGK